VLCPENKCSGHGTCYDNVCECERGWAGKDCEGDICPKDCSGHGVCVDKKNPLMLGTKFRQGCYCHKGWSGKACDKWTGCGLKYCSAEPANGMCDAHGTCKCK